MLQKIKEIFRVSNLSNHITCVIDYEHKNFSIFPRDGKDKFFRFENIKLEKNKTSIISELIKEAEKEALYKLIEYEREINSI